MACTGRLLTLGLRTSVLGVTFTISEPLVGAATSDWIVTGGMRVPTSDERTVVAMRRYSDWVVVDGDPQVGATVPSSTTHVALDSIVYVMPSIVCSGCCGMLASSSKRYERMRS